MAYNALSDNTKSTAVFSWNGAILEEESITVASDGAIITLSIEKLGSGDLTVVFSDGFDSWDTTPADTVTLTAGSDTSPQINYVYYLQSTKALTVSTSSFPATEHAAIATVFCQSAASLQTDGAYKVHVWTDHTNSSENQGHTSEINDWIRQQNASWVSGVDPTLTITPQGGAADDVIFTSSAGIVYQLHNHTFPAFTGTPDIYTINDSVTPYNIVTDLNELLTDSQGGSLSNKYFSLVIWGVQSEDSSDCKLFVNLPSGSYNNQINLISDPSRYTDFSIPTSFRGTGFLIAQLQLRHQAAASGTWTEIDTIDLRGLFPSITAGGTPLGQVEFADNAFRIFDESDNTKEIAFEASSITTATTRTLTVQDRNGTIALEDLLITAIDDTDSTYTVLSEDEMLVCDVSSGVLTINLANTPSTGRVIRIKDSTGDAASNNIIITTVGGSVTIDGSTTFVMNSAYESVSIVFDGSKYLII